MSGVVVGLTDFGRGLRFLRSHPRLWVWVVTPALITILLSIALAVAVPTLITRSQAGIMARLPSWLTFGDGVLIKFALFALVIVLGWYLFVTLASALAGPFNEELSERIEAAHKNQPPPAFSIRVFGLGVMRGLGHALRRLGVTLGGMVLVLVMTLVPGIGPVVGLACAFYFASRAAAYDAFDAYFARRNVAYAHKAAFLARHRGRTLGLGMATAACLAVPVIGVVGLGIAAAGATLAALEMPDATAV